MVGCFNVGKYRASDNRPQTADADMDHQKRKSAVLSQVRQDRTKDLIRE